MDRYLEKDYKRLRKIGWPARDAFNAAKTNVAFSAAEEAGYVRLRAEPDDIAPDLSYLEDDEAAKKKEIARINDQGMWGIISEVKNPLALDGPWEQVDSCWGFVGEDWKDSGYDTDFKNAALEYLNRFMVEDEPPPVRLSDTLVHERAAGRAEMRDLALRELQALRENNEENLDERGRGFVEGMAYALERIAEIERQVFPLKV